MASSGEEVKAEVALDGSTLSNEGGENVVARGDGAEGGERGERVSSKLNVNTCSIDEIRKVPGIGDKTLICILRLREETPHISERRFLEVIRNSEALCQYFTFSSQDNVGGPQNPTDNVAEDKVVESVVVSTAEPMPSRRGVSDVPPPPLSMSAMDIPLVSVRPKTEYGTAKLEAQTQRSHYLDDLRRASQFHEQNEDEDYFKYRKIFRGSRFERDNRREVRERGRDDRQREGDSEKSQVSSMPRTITFDGKEDWRAFRCKFMSFMACQRWSDRMTRDQLCWCLTGTASEYFSRLVYRDPNISSGEVLDKLEKRFDMRDLPETSQMLFNSACQAQKESVVEWADRILRLALNAYPELEDEYVYRQSIMRFCQGLADKEAGHSVLMTRPKTLDEALDRVRWYQHTDQVIYAKGKGVRQVEVESSSSEVEPADVSVCRTGMRYTDEKRSAAKPKPRPVSPKRVQFASEEKVKSLESKVEHLQEQMTAVLAGISSLKLMMKTSRSRSRSPSGCFNCGKQGHFARECPSSTKTVSQVEDLGNSSGSEM